MMMDRNVFASQADAADYLRVQLLQKRRQHAGILNDVHHNQKQITDAEERIINCEARYLFAGEDYRETVEEGLIREEEMNDDLDDLDEWREAQGDERDEGSYSGEGYSEQNYLWRNRRENEDPMMSLIEQLEQACVNNGVDASRAIEHSVAFSCLVHRIAYEEMHPELAAGLQR